MLQFDFDPSRQRDSLDKAVFGVPRSFVFSPYWTDVYLPLRYDTSELNIVGWDVFSWGYPYAANPLGTSYPLAGGHDWPGDHAEKSEVFYRAKFKKEADAGLGYEVIRQPKYKAKVADVKGQYGNVDWYNKHTKTRLSWKGPVGRGLPNPVPYIYFYTDQPIKGFMGYIGGNIGVYENPLWWPRFDETLLGQSNPWLAQYTRFDSKVYRNGRVVADFGDSRVLGAAYTTNAHGKRVLVAVVQGEFGQSDSVYVKTSKTGRVDAYYIDLEGRSYYYTLAGTVDTVRADYLVDRYCYFFDSTGKNIITLKQYLDPAEDANLGPHGVSNIRWPFVTDLVQVSITVPSDGTPWVVDTVVTSGQVQDKTGMGAENVIYLAADFDYNDVPQILSETSSTTYSDDIEYVGDGPTYNIISQSQASTYSLRVNEVELYSGTVVQAHSTLNNGADYPDTEVTTSTTVAGSLPSLNGNEFYWSRYGLALLGVDLRTQVVILRDTTAAASWSWSYNVWTGGSTGGSPSVPITVTTRIMLLGASGAVDLVSPILVELDTSLYPSVASNMRFSTVFDSGVAGNAFLNEPIIPGMFWLVPYAYPSPDPPESRRVPPAHNFFAADEWGHALLSFALPHPATTGLGGVTEYVRINALMKPDGTLVDLGTPLGFPGGTLILKDIGLM